MTVEPRRLLLGSAGVCGAAAAWQLLVATHLLPPGVVPSPWQVLAAGWQDRSGLAEAVGETASAAGLGLLYAVGAGTLLGLACGLSDWLDALSSGLTRLLRPLPSVALVPVAILALGVGRPTVAVLGAYAAFWPVFLGTRYGVRNLDPVLVDTARAFRLTGLAFVLRLVAPAALPSIMSGVKVALALCLVVCVSGEVVIGSSGLGGYVVLAQYGADPGAMYAGIAVGGLAGAVVGALFAGLQHAWTGWAVRGTS